MKKCINCKFYKPEAFWTEGDSEEWRRWGECGNPLLDIDESEFVRAGADDYSGNFWHITADFGCILFKAKEL